MDLGPFNWLTDQEALKSLLSQNEAGGVALVGVVIFCETGLVVLPFLPGDSLLFGVGALAALSSRSPVAPLAVVLLAAICGDLVNYLVGKSFVGRWLLQRKWISDEHMAQTRSYFDRYGAVTVTIGRFIPVVRTIAPFVAGLTGMPLRRFIVFNVAGAVAWCCLMLLGGYWLGRVDWIANHFQVVSLLIVAISVVPLAWQWWRARGNSKTSS
jgi:membrane-associated protein